jgi:hypothetical protein
LRARAEQEVHLVGLAPRHQLVAGEAAIGAEQDLHAGPAGADARDDTGDLLGGACAGVDVGPPQLRSQQVIAAEDVERQIAVAVVIAVEEPPLLPPVDRVVGRIEIQGDARRRLLMGVEEQLDEQRLDGGGIVADAAVAIRPGGRMLQPVERAFARQRREAGPARLDPPQCCAERGVAAQVVMIDQILVAESDAEHPLADQRCHVMAHPPRHPAVAEAGGEALDQPDGPVGRAQQQRARVRGDRAAAEICHHGASIDACKAHRLRATLCWHRGLPVGRRKCLFALTLYRSAAPMRQTVVRYAG